MGNLVNGDQFTASNIAADETSDLLDFRGGRVTLVAYGTSFGGGAVSLVYQPPGGATSVIAKDIAGNAATLSADGMVTCDLPAGKIGTDFTGSSGASGMYIFLGSPDGKRT